MTFRPRAATSALVSLLVVTCTSNSGPPTAADPDGLALSASTPIGSPATETAISAAGADTDAGARSDP